MENRKTYNKTTEEIKKKAKRCKEKWLEEKWSEVENSAGVQNTGKLFQVVGQICGTVSPRMSTVKDNARKSLESKEEIKQRWKQYYEELYNERNPVDSAVLAELPASSSQEQMDDILRDEVEAAVRSLKTRKAPGEDNIVAEMIQAGESCSVEMLHMLCNKIDQEKKCSADSGKAIIVPIGPT